jgi:hypothetical protein
LVQKLTIRITSVCGPRLPKSIYESHQRMEALALGLKFFFFLCLVLVLNTVGAVSGGVRCSAKGSLRERNGIVRVGMKWLAIVMRKATEGDARMI